MKSSLHRRRPRILWGLLLVAMLLRALVPAGYMVGGDGADGLAVKLCHVVGAEQGASPAHPGDPAEGGSKHQPCAYAVSAAGAPLPDFPRVQPTPMRVFAGAPESESRPHVPSIHRSQSSRGPPASA